MSIEKLKTLWQKYFGTSSPKPTETKKPTPVKVVPPHERLNSLVSEIGKDMFGVKVKDVITSNVQGKKKVFKGKVGQRINWKKAVVKVSEGQMIDATAS